MKRSPFFLLAAALMGLSSIGAGATLGTHSLHDAKIAFNVATHERAALHWMAAARTNQPDPPPWLLPNQRQRRLARRRQHAAGDRFAFA